MDDMTPTNRNARIAGALYLLLTAFGLFSLMYVPATLIVRTDAAATARNILANETLFRLGIAGNVLGSVVFVLVAFALYRLLAGVDATNAALMAILAIASVPIAFVNAAVDLGVLTVLHGGDSLSIFSRPQLGSLAMLLLRLHHNGDVVAEIFWGLWLFPFGLLVIKSRVLPKLLGVLLIINGCAYVAMSMTSILSPAAVATLSPYATVAETGEVWTMLWLLVMGARPFAVTPAAAMTKDLA